MFIGSPGRDRAHLFGGQLLGQGLLAAARCTDDAMRAQSLHAVFLMAGAGDRAVEYRVDRLRDGSSFATRRVLGLQDGQPIVSLTASFHRAEGEPLHQVPAPTGVGSPHDHRPGRYDSAEVECFDIRRARLDQNPEPGASSDSDPSPDPLTLGHWSRVRGGLPSGTEPALFDAALAWASDQGPTRAARQPHLDHPGFDRIRTTSLDHHLWFHQATDLTGWHVTTLRSSATADARGLVHGTIHDTDGRHVASLTQEVLVRLPDQA